MRSLIRTHGALFIVFLLAMPATGQAPTIDEARELLEQGRWNRAVGSFRWITREEPENAAAWIGLIEALRGKGDFDGALEAATQAKEFPRVAPQALFLRGCVLAELGEVEAALSEIERAVRNGFSDAEAMRSEAALAPLDDGRLTVPQGREVRELEMRGESVRYLLATPPGFRSGGTYPALVAFGPGRQDLEAAEFLLAHFVGEQAVQMGWVVVAPETPPGGWSGPDGIRVFEELLDELNRRLDIEGGRAHLVGAGNGAYTGFVLAQATPDRVQSLTAMSGAPPPGAALTALTDVRVRQFVGEVDGTWIASVRQMHEALQEAGVDAELEVLAGEGHFLGSLSGYELMQRVDGLRSR